MATVSVQRSVPDNFSRRQEKLSRLEWTPPICDSALMRSTRRGFAPLQKERRDQRSYVRTEALYDMVFRAGAPKKSGVVWFGHNWNLKRVPGLRVMSFNWATKIVVTSRYRAEPSVFTVAPRGSIKRQMSGPTLLFSSTQRFVVGSVAALQLEKKSVKWYFSPTQAICLSVNER